MKKVKTKVGDVGLLSKDDLILIGRTSNKTFTKLIYLANNYIGWLSELDKELEEFVDSKQHRHSDYDLYMNYEINAYTLGNVKQSFISLIKSQHPEFDSEKEYLLIKLL